MKEIKVLVILPNLEMGGAEKVTITLLPGLNKLENIKADLCLIRNKGDLLPFAKESSNYNIYTILEKDEKLSYNFLKMLYKVLKISKSYDIIIGGLQFNTTYLSQTVAKILNKKHIAWIQNNLEIQFENVSDFNKDKILFKIMYSQIKNLLFPSIGVMKNYEAVLNKKNQIKKVIYNPINIAKVLELADKPLNEYSLGDNYIIAIGRLTPQKGFDILIKAFNLLVKRNPKLNYKLVIIGEGYERNNLESLIKQLNMENKILLLGQKRNPYPYVKNADFFVSSSRYEGLPTIILETLALGKAIISTDCPSGPAEILENGKYGILTPVKDVEQLSKNIELFIKNKELKISFEKKAQERAKDFDIDNIILQWQTFLEEVYAG